MVIKVFILVSWKLFRFFHINKVKIKKYIWGSIFHKPYFSWICQLFYFYNYWNCFVWESLISTIALEKNIESNYLWISNLSNVLYYYNYIVLIINILFSNATVVITKCNFHSYYTFTDLFKKEKHQTPFSSNEYFSTTI